MYQSWRTQVAEFRVTPFPLVVLTVKDGTKERDREGKQDFLSTLYEAWTKVNNEIETLSDWEAFPHIRKYFTTLKKKYQYSCPGINQAAQEYRYEKRRKEKRRKRDSKLLVHWRTVDELLPKNEEILALLRQMKEVEVPLYKIEPIRFEAEEKNEHSETLERVETLRISHGLNLSFDPRKCPFSASFQGPFPDPRERVPGVH